MVPTTGFDNPAVHRKLALLSGNPRGYPASREPGSGVADELLTGDDAILTLNAYRRTGDTCATVVTIDVTHTFKNGSLMPLHLSRLLMLGSYAMLAMMLVSVQIAAGMLASDVNGADPMDVGAAERRLNQATRRELAKDPANFGLVAYLWAVASARAAWMDREKV